VEHNRVTVGRSWFSVFDGFRRIFDGDGEGDEGVTRKYEGGD
jgi:hypothetical protein